MSIAKKIMQAAGAAGGGQESGNYIAVAHEGSVTLLDHTTPGSLTFSDNITSGFTGGAHPRSVQFSPDGNYIAVTQVSNGGFQLLDHTTPGSLSTSSSYTLSNNGNGVSYGPNGDYIAVGHVADGSGTFNFTLLNASSGSVSFSDSYVLGSSTSSPARGSGVSFSPDGNYIAAGSFSFNSSPDFTLLSRSGGSVSFSDSFSGVGNNVYSCEFSPDGNYIAVGGETSPYFTLLNHSSGSLSSADTYTLSSFMLGTSAISWSPDSDYIAVAHFSSPYVTLLDHTSSGSVSLASTYNLGGTAMGSAFHPEGTYIAITMRSSPTLTLLNHSGGTLSLAATYTLSSNAGDGGCAFSPI